MSCNLVSVYYLCIATVLTSVAGVNIVVSPPEKELSPGDSVTLTCHLDDASIVQNGRFSWVYPENMNHESVTIEGTYFTIRSMSESNIGTYTCKYIGLDSTGQLLSIKATSDISIKAVLPGMPQNLQPTSFSGNTINLQWETGFWGYADTLYYKLEYMEEDSPWLKWREDIPAESLTYVVTDLTLEQSYQFRISQINRVGESVPSAPSSPIFLPKEGGPLTFPMIKRLEPLNATAIRIIWSMPEFSEIVTAWFVQFRIKEEGSYTAVKVIRSDLTLTMTILGGLEEAQTYQIRMFCRNERGRGPSSQPREITTSEAAPSEPPQSVDVKVESWKERQIRVMWKPPPDIHMNGVITGYQIRIHYSDPSDPTEPGGPEPQSIDAKLETAQYLDVTELPCYVAVAAKTEQGMGPFSQFQKAEADAIIEQSSTNEMMELIKEPWLIAIIGALVLIVIVMISIIICRQQKIRKRKLQQHHPNDPYKPFHSNSVNSSMSNQYRMRDDGPQYEKIPDSRNTTPHNSYIENRMAPPNYCPSNLSMDSRQYSMSQNSSIDDIASTIPSVTYSIPHGKDGYKVVNPTHNERAGQDIPVAKVPPKAKEHDPNAIKPKVYGNITVKEWREQQLRKKTRGDATSDTSLLSSFGKDSGRGSTDNVSISGSESEEGSDVEKYLEEDYSPRNSGYIEDDLMDVARMGMSRSPPEDSTFLNPNNRAKNHPPIAAENHNRDNDNTSIESDMYMRCEAAPNAALPTNMYHLNGGVSESED